MTFDELLARLQEFDLILDADPKFPSITGFVTGDAVRGSWWAHPQSKEMYQLACRLRDHPDVLLAKLVSGKVTLIHRPLCPAVFAIGTAREPWQMQTLSKEARALLKQVDKEATVQSSGDKVRELEARLLVHSESVHTERGFHMKNLRRWQSSDLKPAEARAQLEAVVARLNKQFNARGTLPWQKKIR